MDRCLRLLPFTVAAGVLAGVACAPVRAQSSFPDVPADHWAAAAVRQLKEAGIVVGYPPAPAPRPRARAAYAGDKPVTRYELALTLWRFVQYTEQARRQKTGALAGPEAVRRLVSGGYLPAGTPLAKQGDKPVTANQLADALSQVIARATERKTPVTPDSRRAPLQRRPGQAPTTGAQ